MSHVLRDTDPNRATNCNKGVMTSMTTAALVQEKLLELS